MVEYYGIFWKASGKVDRFMKQKEYQSLMTASRIRVLTSSHIFEDEPR